jgi:hypothetical protein
LNKPLRSIFRKIILTLNLGITYVSRESRLHSKYYLIELNLINWLSCYVYEFVFAYVRLIAPKDDFFFLSFLCFPQSCVLIHRCLVWIYYHPLLFLLSGDCEIAVSIGCRVFEFEKLVRLWHLGRSLKVYDILLLYFRH